MESFFTKLVDKTVGSVYLRDYNRNIADLRNRLQLLKESREAVKSVVPPEVEQWLARVDKVIREYDELLRPEEFEVNRFIDLKSRYKVSRKAKQGILLADWLQLDFKFIQAYDPAPSPAPTYDFTLRRDLGVFESRRPTYEAIMKALQGDEISIIGVYGMAGVGKTTLVREIAKYAEFNHLFDEIVMAVVSPTPNIRKIQGEIADALGLQFDVESDYGRAGRLYARIKNVKKILVILDDLRTALDLEAIGIPHGDAHEGCKIVLTSRELDVCHQMNAQTSSYIQVLSESEAWTLFEKTASNIEEVPDVLPVAQKVAKECGGLPVAIISVAKALRGKNDIVWKDALRELKESEGLHDHISRSLKLSYDLLKTEELKTCFLLCSLFPEDSDIPIEYLVRYGIGLRWYTNFDSLIEARFSVHTMIDELKACGLLMDGIDKGSTRMHDVVRDFAISVASGGEHAFLVIVGSGGVTGWPKVEALNQYKVISLIGNCVKKSPPYGLVCPNLEMLLLQCESDSVEMPNQFFEGMKKLRVLHLRRMSIPLSLGYLKKLRTLCLECCKIPDDLREIKELEDLEILSIVDSDIEELPSAIGQLSKLRLLDLAYCKKLKVISPGILARLTQLEGLYMRNSFKDWAGHGRDSNASLTELKALSSLEALEMHIPDAELYPKDLLLDKLTEFKITIGGDFDRHDIYSYSRNLKLENLSDTLEGGGVNVLLTRAELVVLKDSMVEQNVLFDLTHHDFQNLRVVTVFDCDKLKSLFRHIMGRGLGQLCELDVRSCSNMEAILKEDGGTVAQEDDIVFSDLKSLKLIGLPNLMSFLDVRLHEPLFHRKVVFPSLEELYLWGLDNMEEIWYKQLLPAQSFYSLRDLSIGSCEKLITVIPSNLSGRLTSLAKFSVWDCDSVQEICEGRDATSLILPQISVLRFWGLPKLEHIWWNKVSHKFICLQNIKILRIYRCKSLRYVFSVSVSKDLGQLETLAVGKCDMMKAIIADEGQEKIEAVKRIVFPKLHTLELKCMEQLTSFYQGDCDLEFGSVEIWRIEKCPLLKTFNPKEASATAQPFGGEQMHSFSSHGPITPKLHNIKLGGLTELQKRHIHCIAQCSTIRGPITPELHFTESRSLPGSSTRPFRSILRLRSFKEPPVTTAVMKVNLHCEGCIQKIQRVVTKTKGYHEVAIDRQNDLVTVKGSMDMKALAKSLKKQLKKDVQIVPPKKEGEKKEKGGGGDKEKGGREGKSSGDGAGDGVEKLENKFRYPFVPQPQPPYVFRPVYGDHLHAPRMFSDEDPNACTIM